jgi:hypothetical protein
MTRSIRSVAVSALAALVALTAGALPVLARESTTTATGNDISWPHCGRTYPTGQAFGIVGVNGGLANNQNPCFAGELSWGWTSTGTSAPGILPKTALSVNTSDPGQVVPAVADWPTSNVDPNGASEAPGATNPDPFGSCTGSNSTACAWQYGWDRAVQDMLWLIATSPIGGSNLPSAYAWWLDVETVNSWETGSSGLANNLADLQGMVAAFSNTAEVTAAGVHVGGASTVGIYTTSAQWNQITGNPGAAGLGKLAGLPDWIPGSRTLTAGPQSNCSLKGYTGVVTITQWFAKPYDADYACKV